MKDETQDDEPKPTSDGGCPATYRHPTKDVPIRCRSSFGHVPADAHADRLGGWINPVDVEVSKTDSCSAFYNAQGPGDKDGMVRSCVRDGANERHHSHADALGWWPGMQGSGGYSPGTTFHEGKMGRPLETKPGDSSRPDDLLRTGSDAYALGVLSMAVRLYLVAFEKGETTDRLRREMARTVNLISTPRMRELLPVSED